MLPGGLGNIPDLAQRGPEYYQQANLRSGKLPERSGKLPKTLVIFRTSSAEVRNINRIFGSFQDLAGSFPDLKFACW